MDTPWLGWLHILSDLGIWSAYVAIPCVLIYFVVRRRGLPFRGIFFLFGAFILCCGTTHFMEALIFYWPLYRLAGVIKFITAVVSWTTVLALAPIVPKALTMRSAEELEKEIVGRKNAESDLQKANEELERRVAARTAELTQAVAALETERELLRTTLGSIGDGVIATDPEGRVTYLNPVAEHLTGWSTVDASGRPLTEVFRIVNEQTRQEAENPAGKALREGRIVGLANHTILIGKDGIERPIEDSAAPITHGRRTFGVVLVFRDVVAKRAAETALRASEERLSLALDAAGLGLWDWDVPGEEMIWNSHHETIFGYEPGQAVRRYRDFADRVFPDDLAKIEAGFRQASEQRSDYRFEHRVVWPDGGIRWVESFGRFHHDQSGHPIRSVGVLLDVTERKRAEEHLRESEERFRQLADAMPQIVWSAKPDGTIDYVNRQWREFTGLPPEAGVSGWDQIIHPDDAGPSRERWAASLRTGAPFEMEIRLLDRRRQAYRWHLVRTLAVHDPSGKVSRWFGASTDIDEQKRGGESSRYLAEASAALSGVVDYAGALQKVANLAVPYFADWSAVDIVGDDGAVKRLTVAHQDPAKVSLMHELMQKYPPDPKSPTGVNEVIRGGKPVLVSPITDEMLVRGAKDEVHLSLIRSLGLRSYISVPLVVSGCPLGALTFATAESGRLYAESDLALAADLAQRAAVAIENAHLYQSLREADRHKDVFLATLAHELRNPLAPIRSGLQVLRLSNEPAAQERARGMMERQLGQLVRLVDDLLDISRINRGKLELRKSRIDLASVIDNAVETVRPLIESKGHELIVKVPPAPVYLDADLTRLSQVFWNLLNNSAKYTDPGGRIELIARVDDKEVVVVVRDNGMGIPAAALPGLFNMFSQVDHSLERSQGGLGIGLALVKGLSEMHGGGVAVRSAGLGKGSEFEVRLPVAQGGAETNAPSRKEDAGSAPMRVVVVDDNRDGAASMAMMLSLAGHQTRTAHDGLEAIELAEAFRPEVLLLDIGLPKLNGYDTCRRIREQPWGKEMFIVAVTGWGQDEDRRRSEESGFDRHVVKPISFEALQEILAEAQQRGGGEQRGDAEP